MGLRCACLGEAVVVWCYDADMAEYADLTEGDMHLARTPISTPPSAQVTAKAGKRTRGLSLCLIGGAGGGKGGLKGTSNSLIVI